MLNKWLIVLSLALTLQNRSLALVLPLVSLNGGLSYLGPFRSPAPLNFQINIDINKKVVIH